MTVELPYKIGTILKTTRDGKVQYDKVNHYIVGWKTKVVLELGDDRNKILSEPMFLDELFRNWEEVDEEN